MKMDHRIIHQRHVESVAILVKKRFTKGRKSCQSQSLRGTANEVIDELAKGNEPILRDPVNSAIFLAMVLQHIETLDSRRHEARMKRVDAHAHQFAFDSILRDSDPHQESEPPPKEPVPF